MSDYCFESFKEFFEYNLKKSVRDAEGQKVLTLNDLAKKLGYNSPSLLSMIANGKRLPSSEILESLFDEWKIESNLRELVRLRLEIEKKSRKNRPTLALQEKLARLDKKSTFKTIDLDTFNTITEWQHVVLQQLVTAPDFKEDYHLLSQRLRKKVSPAQVKKSIATLVKAGFLKRNAISGELEPRGAESTAETTHDIPSEAIREHHKAMINRAIEAIDEQSVEQRHINSLTLRFNEERKNEAKDAILNFVRDFNNRFYDADSNSIHQLNVQFFEHTQKVEQNPIIQEYVQ